MGNKPIVHAPIATGSTESRDIRDRFADWCNVKDFGAKGDGETDDFAAFGAAATASNGKPIFVPVGTYYLSDDITGNFFSLGPVVVVGVGKVTIVDILEKLSSGVVHKDSFDHSEFIKGYKTFGNNLTVFDTTIAQSVAPSEDWFKYLAFYGWSDPSLRNQDINPLDYSLDKWWRYGGIEYALRSNGIVDGKFYIYTNPTGSGQTTHWHYVSLEGNPADDYIRFRPVGNGVILLGSGANRWKQVYAATATISTSDARLKTTPEPVPDAVLDAWGDVQFCQFQMLDAVERKGAESARIHNGLIAQRIGEIFKARGLDASRYGLFCFDSWEAVPESRDKDGTVHEPAEPAGDMYSLRYEEVLCMEATYQRRRADRAEARITSLEERLAILEAKLEQ